MKHLILAAAMAAHLTLPDPSSAKDPGGRLLTLAQAVEIALANNHNLKAANELARAAGLRTRSARLDLLPKADLQLSYSRLDPATVRRGNVFIDVGRSLVKSFATESDPNDIRPGA